MTVADLDAPSMLLAGTFLGVRHAFEADHIAAVLKFHGGEGTLGRGVAMGAAWGVGHAGLLVLLVSATAISGSFGSVLEWPFWELPVAITLIWMGRRAIPGVGERERAGSTRPVRGPTGAFLVGSLHGLAGTGGFLVLISGAEAETFLAVGQALVFGLGSVLGMLVFTVALGTMTGATSPSARAIRAFRVGADWICLSAGLLLILDLL